MTRNLTRLRLITYNCKMLIQLDTVVNFDKGILLEEIHQDLHQR